MNDNAPAQKNTRRVGRDCLASLLLLSLAIVFFGKVIFTSAPVVLGKPFLVDLTNQWYPWRFFGFGMLKAGMLPLWNPYCFCGTPFLANWYSGLFYPPNWTFLVLPVRIALNYSFVIHVALCGVFTYAYMRIVIGDRLASLFAAITFMFSAQLILRIFAGHLSLVCAMAWFPLELSMLEQGLRKGRIGYYLLCGAAFAAQITSGYPQLVLYSGIMAALYFICRLPASMGEGGGLRWAGVALAGAAALCAVAIGLSAVQLLPSLEFTAHSSRQAMTYAEAAGSSFPPENVATFLAPELFGDFNSANCTGRAFLWEASAYMGIFPLVLALLALCYRRNRYTTLFAVLGAASFVIALGGYTPALKFLYLYAPGFNVIRGNSKAFFVTAYCLSFLAGIGFRLLKDELSPENKHLRKCCIRLIVVLLLLSAALAGAVAAPAFRTLCGKACLGIRGAFLIEGERPPLPGAASPICPNLPLCARGAYRSILFLLLAVVVIGVRMRRRVNGALLGILIGMASVIDLWSFAGGYVVTSMESSCWWPRGIVRFFKGDDSIYRTSRDIRVPAPGVNQNMIDGIYSLDGYEANTVADFAEFIDSFGLRSEDVAGSMLRPERNKFISLANVKYLMVPSLVRGALPEYHPRLGGKNVIVYENANVMPRAFIVHRAAVAKDRRDAIEIMKGNAFDPREMVVLDEEPEISPLSDAAESVASIVSYTSGGVDVLCGLQEPGILVLSDVYYPGWEVAVDGKPGRIIRANYAFRAVALDRGAHRVHFSYRPFSFRCGAWISLITIALCALWGLIRWRRARRGREPGAGGGSTLSANGLIILLCCIPLLQAVVLPWMPGLDSDKAAGGIAAYNIIHGDDSILKAKTVTYAGTLRLYAEILIFLIGGASRFTLELSFAIYNSLTILFVFLSMRRLFGARAGLWSALVFSVSPWLVFRDIDNFFCTVIAAYLYCFSFGTAVAYFFGGIVLGLGCYENQRAAVIVLSAFISWIVCGKKGWAGVRDVFLTGVGCVIGFSPRLIYSVHSNTRIYMEPFNGLIQAIGDACTFIPYFFGMIDGVLIYIRNAGRIVWPVIPFNSVVFVGAALLLLLLRRSRLYLALLIFTLFMYLLPFTVIKYTAIRYFLFALFGATLVAGLGLYELSLRYKKTAVALLAVYCCVNVFYLCTNFFIPFVRTGGVCLLFKMGNLLEASHHLVRSDVLYECLDKRVPVIVCPEPFISTNILFYDVTKGCFKKVTGKMEEHYDDFYFIDYSPSKMRRKVEPSKFPDYLITRECRELRNFSVYRFRKKGV